MNINSNVPNSNIYAQTFLTCVTYDILVIIPTCFSCDNRVSSLPVTIAITIIMYYVEYYLFVLLLLFDNTLIFDLYVYNLSDDRITNVILVFNCLHNKIDVFLQDINAAFCYASEKYAI